MKNNSFFRCHRLFLIPFFFLFFGNRVHPQSVIYTSNQYSEYSIIRNYKKNVDITYSLIGDIAMNSRGFNYVDRYSTTIVSAEIPLNYAINDFVVYYGHVYFCGSVGSGNVSTPIYGYFDIQDVFFRDRTENTVWYFQI